MGLLKTLLSKKLSYISWNQPWSDNHLHLSRLMNNSSWCTKCAAYVFDETIRDLLICKFMVSLRHSFAQLQWPIDFEQLALNRVVTGSWIFFFQIGSGLYVLGSEQE